MTLGYDVIYRRATGRISEIPALLREAGAEARGEAKLPDPRIG
jgi:hypothetical protein